MATESQDSLQIAGQVRDADNVVAMLVIVVDICYKLQIGIGCESEDSVSSQTSIAEHDIWGCVEVHLADIIIE